MELSFVTTDKLGTLNLKHVFNSLCSVVATKLVSGLKFWLH